MRLPNIAIGQETFTIAGHLQFEPLVELWDMGPSIIPRALKPILLTHPD